METPEGQGVARRAWEATWAVQGGDSGAPAVGVAVCGGEHRRPVRLWVVWHLEGGFEGMQRMGMSRASIYRRIKLFRIAFGAHPDEFEMPGITLDLVAFREGWAAMKKGRGEVADLRLSVRPARHSLWMRLRPEPLWTLSLYPEAAEGGGCLSVRRTGRRRVGRRMLSGRRRKRRVGRGRRSAATRPRTG